LVMQQMAREMEEEMESEATYALFKNNQVPLFSKGAEIAASFEPKTTAIPATDKVSELETLEPTSYQSKVSLEELIKTLELNGIASQKIIKDGEVVGLNIFAPKGSDPKVIFDKLETCELIEKTSVAPTKRL